MQVILGGSKYQVMDKTRYIYNKLEALMAKRPDELLEIVSLKDANALGDLALAELLVKKMGVDQICVHLLGMLHDRIVQLYLGLIDEWRAKNPQLAADMKFVESKEIRPPNYTPAMTRLKNMSWSRFEPKMGGFCIKEPIIRILQLMDYPINTFAKITINTALIPIPARPEWKDAGKKSRTTQELYTRILELRPLVQDLERWYLDMCHAVELVIKKMQTDLTF